MTTAAPETIEIAPLIGSRVRETMEVPEGLHIVRDGDVRLPNSGMFRILHPEKGDERLTWDRTSLAEIQAAKQMFVDLIKKGLTPYRVGVNGKRSSEVMKEFDPRAEEVIFVPTKLVVGG